MDKKMVTAIAITAIVVLIAAPKLRQLPIINKLPTA